MESGGSAAAVVQKQSFCTPEIIRMGEDLYKSYPHNPPHLFRPNAVYMVTGGILNRLHLLISDEAKGHFCQTLFERALRAGWGLEAWAVMSNHYHFVARAQEDAVSLSSLVRGVHSISAKFVNALDRTPGRKVWYNYWDTCITQERSYLARLQYVHLNPVKHGIVRGAEDYPFCSFRWFIESAEPGFRTRVLDLPIDHLHVMDDF